MWLLFWLDLKGPFLNIVINNMRSIFFIFSMALPSVCMGQAEFGLKGGLNLSDIVMTNYVNPDVESDLGLKLGVHAGAFVNRAIDERLGLAAELLYSNKGVKGFSNINLHYITLPLLVQYKLTENIRAEIGAEPGYLFSAKSNLGSVANTYNNKLDLGLDGGFQLHVGKCILGIRYCAGIFSVKEPLEHTAGPGERVKFQNRVLQVAIGYKLGILE